MCMFGVLVFARWSGAFVMIAYVFVLLSFDCVWFPVFWLVLLLCLCCFIGLNVVLFSVCVVFWVFYAANITVFVYNCLMCWYVVRLCVCCVLLLFV